DCGLCALDLVYGGDDGLERWLARQIGADRVLARTRTAATPERSVVLGEGLELGALLRDLASGGHSIGPDTLSAAGQAEGATPDLDELEARFTTVAQMLDARAAEAEAAAAASGPR